MGSRRWRDAPFYIKHNVYVRRAERWMREFYWRRQRRAWKRQARKEAERIEDGRFPNRHHSA
jgi:hypothetical protein